MQTIMKKGAIALGIFLGINLASRSQTENLSPVPPDEVPQYGTFFSAQNFPPMPVDLWPNLPVYSLGNGSFLIDDSSVNYSAMDDSGVTALPDDGTNSSGGGGPSPDPSFSTNGLWIQITGINNGIVSLNLNNATDMVYEVWTKTNLNETIWNIELEVFPTNQEVMPFTIAEQGRTNLMVWARDWTSVTSNGNQTPEWWFWKYFGTVNLLDTDLDVNGNTLLYDYQNGIDPNVIIVINLNFNHISATAEGAMRLSWNSTSNQVYEIDEADALATNADGSTTWKMLYDDYPSQGTNTFWLDTGNYNLVPLILHPKYMPMRFYRIMYEGTDTTSDEPVASISSPTNGAIVSGELTINVLAATDQPVLSGTKLYVDGQEMQMADSTTNYADGSTNYEVDTYSINTCEWRNGTHTFFATVECESGFGDAVGSPPVSSGHGVSPFIPVIFSNLVTGISFSQPFFNPSSGQTQQISAIFAANVVWTLNIEDVFSNVVFTTTGSGTSMQFNWDGNGTGETNLPTGIYYNYITAETNGDSDSIVSDGSDDSGGSGVPSPAFASSVSQSESAPMQLWAQPSDGSGSAVPLIIYPPGFDTNDLTIFEAPLTWGLEQSASVSSAESFGAMDTDGGASPAYAGASSQPAPPAPQRPPINPIRGLAGTFGVANDTFLANGTKGFNIRPLDNGLGIGIDIAMNGFSAGATLKWGQLPEQIAEGNNFVSQMQHWGWKNTLCKIDNQLSINDLIGSGSPYNNVNLAVFIGHCAYGTSIDYAANGCKQMYLPITSGNGAQYLRMSQMNLGGSGTSGLKWFAIEACDSLYKTDWQNMQNLGVKPYNSNLHLLLGTATTSYADPNILALWSKYMNYGTTNTYNPLTIRSAWYQAATDAYAKYAFPSGTTITFAVAGDSACQNDMLQTNYTPAGSWNYNSQQVYPPQ
jgi:hypothetical protein